MRFSRVVLRPALLQGVSLAAVSLLVVSNVQAIEVTPRGQIQLQANYLEPKLANGKHWALSMPDNSFGVMAAEQLSNSILIGHWQVGIDPLASGETAVLTQEQAYLNWRQGIMGLWAGRLPSVEQAFLVDLTNNHLALPNKGLAIGDLVALSENNAVRLDISSGDYLVFTGQWIIDDTEEDIELSAATVVRSPEGTISLTYRKPPGEEALWGNQITWDVGSTSLSAVWMYQEEILGWDITARSKMQKVHSFVSYSVKGDEARWSVGVQQQLSEAVTNYSEIIWWPDDSGWQWSTGFQMKF